MQEKTASMLGWSSICLQHVANWTQSKHNSPLVGTARADSERYSIALRTADDEYHCLSPMPFAGYTANDAEANITVALVMS